MAIRLALMGGMFTIKGSIIRFIFDSMLMGLENLRNGGTIPTEEFFRKTTGPPFLWVNRFLHILTSTEVINIEIIEQLHDHFHFPKSCIE